ncbi:MAG: gluconokinase, partial [Anaerolineae bacterium]|nr:gluconokinase [Anaerolineae bacterium]
MATTEPVILGVDAGTTACKVVVADSDARILGIGSGAYPVQTPRPGWAEQDAGAVWDGVVRALRAALDASGVAAGRVRALSFSGALHSLLPVDADVRPLSGALIWADTRSAAAARNLRARIDATALYRRTGCPLQAMYPLAKLLWLRDHRPDIFAAARRWLSLKDYLIYRLTGRVLTEPSIASGAGCLDIGALAWDAEALALAGVAPAQLPEIRPSATQIPILPGVAAEIGLPDDAVIVLGGSDGALANIGAGAVAPGCAALTVGTSGAVRFVAARDGAAGTVSAHTFTHPQEKTWCYLAPGGDYLVGGAINNGGLVLNWYHDVFGAVEDEQRAAEALAPGADGLIFLPFLTGERCPNWNADAR